MWNGQFIGLRRNSVSWIAIGENIESAKFSLRAEAFSREIAARIRAELFDNLPSDVRVEQRSESEETHPEARGPEPFAPLHAYVYRAAGNIVGSFEEVLQLQERARLLDFVETGPLHLEGKNLRA